MRPEIVVGGHWVSLDVGVVDDLEWSTVYRHGGQTSKSSSSPYPGYQPAGLHEVKWRMDLGGDLSAAPALRNGAVVRLVADMPLGYAILSEPVPGRPAEFYAEGIGRVLARMPAIDGSGNATTRPDTAIDAAIARNSRLSVLSRPASLSNADLVSAASSPLNTVGALLDAWASENGRVWGVDADGQVVAHADPTEPAWALSPDEAMAGTADDEYVSHLYGRWVSAMTPEGNPSAWSVTVVGDDGSPGTASHRWGRVEATIDLTPLGLLNGSRAASVLDGRLASLGPRMGWSNAAVGDSVTLARIGGADAALHSVEAGQMIRAMRVLDESGALDWSGRRDIILSQVTHRAGEEAITLVPVGLAPRDFAGALEVAVAEPTEALRA